MRARVYCYVHIEMIYEGNRTFTRSTWHNLRKTAWMHDGSGTAYIGKKIYGERMNERLIDAEVVHTSCSVDRV